MSEITKIEEGILNAEHKFVHGLANLFSKQHVDEALAIAKRAADIAGYVLPYVQELAMIVPGSPISPALVQAAELMQVKIEDVLTQASSAQKSGTLVGLAGQAGLKAMEQALTAGEIKIGDLTIKVPEDFSKIPQSQLDHAVQAAYTLYVAPYLQKTLDQPTTPPAA